MSIEGLEDLSSDSVEVEVYIEGKSDDFMLTSYQCAFSFNQSVLLSNLSFQYIPESSELVNQPDLYIGVDNIDGEYELTFVSYIGNDIITSTKSLIGRFIISADNLSELKKLNLQWNFDGTINTILTGENFDNITNTSFHSSSFSTISYSTAVEKINIASSSASDAYGTDFSESNLYDGITSSSSSDNTGRWAVSGFPQWVTIDLGGTTSVDNIKIDPFGSEDGISYDCEFYSGTYDNKELILKETTQTGEQWSTHTLGNVETRYITILVTGSEGNDWTDFWEVEVYGYSTTSVDDSNDDEKLDEQQEQTLPTDFAVSQNYPNPFNPSTNVEVSMKKDASAKLTVYNLLGERVLDVFDGQLTAGVHEININAAGLPSGVYVYKLDVDNSFSEIKKMNLIK